MKVYQIPLQPLPPIPKIYEKKTSTKKNLKKPATNKPPHNKDVVIPSEYREAVKNKEVSVITQSDVLDEYKKHKGKERKS